MLRGCAVRRQRKGVGSAKKAMPRKARHGKAGSVRRDVALAVRERVVFDARAGGSILALALHLQQNAVSIKLHQSYRQFNSDECRVLCLFFRINIQKFVGVQQISEKLRQLIQ